jgi:ATPase subunit of ABC transporter with duplicated ATPase domains
MIVRARITAVALAGLIAVAGADARSADTRSAALDQSQLDQAVAAKLRSDDAARDSIRSLLRRDDVRKLAQGYGLDARRAEAAVGTLSGEELQRVAAHAAVAQSALAGGDELVIRMSLVALLLIVIIVLLVAH